MPSRRTDDARHASFRRTGLVPRGDDVTNRWTFGADPLPQTVRAAALLRRVTTLVVALEQEEGAVEQLLHDLERAERELSELVPADPAPRVGTAVSGQGRVYVDHAYAIGAHNP
jgi:hypothetical protein